MRRENQSRNDGGNYAVVAVAVEESIKGSYDDEADVLYISIGDPKPALGVDLGDGVIVRYDETRNEIVGATIIGLRERTARELADSQTE